jgi:xylulokinase
MGVLGEERVFIGIDLGTSSVKSILIDANDHVIASASAPLDVSRPQPTFSEQNPEDWWNAAIATLDKLKETAPKEMAAVKGIGLSGQQHGATLLDKDGKVLRPCILWNDGRSELECKEIAAQFPEISKITGNPAMPGFTAPKLLWVRRHEPEIFAKVATVLLPKAYLRYRLTGELVEEMSDASGTLWLDVGKRDWSDVLLAATYMSRKQMPRLIEGNAVSGTLKSDLAQRWGMAKPPVLAGGGGDNAAGAVGLGAIHPGDAFVSLGTSGVLWATTAGFAPNRNLLIRAMLSSRWGPPACSGRPRRALHPTATSRSTPSAMRSPTPGIRWVSFFRRHPASPGGPRRPRAAKRNCWPSSAMRRSSRAR